MDPNLDEGVDGVDEWDRDGEDKTEEEVEAGVSDLSTDGLDAHFSDRDRVLECSDITVFVVSMDLVPPGVGVDERVLKVNMWLIRQNV